MKIWCEFGASVVAERRHPLRAYRRHHYGVRDGARREIAVSTCYPCLFRSHLSEPRFPKNAGPCFLIPSTNVGQIKAESELNAVIISSIPTLTTVRI